MPLPTPAYLTNQGFGYPFSLYGKLNIVSGNDYISQGVLCRIRTAFFELLMKPQGSRVPELLFEQIDPILFTSLQVYISDALQSYSLITLLAIQVTDGGDNNVNCKITYKTNQSNQISTFTVSLAANLGGS